MDKDGKTKVGKELTFEITKGKAGTHEGKIGSFRYYFDPPEVDVDTNIVNYCSANGIVRRAGATYYVGEQKFTGKNEFLDALADSQTGLRNTLWKLMVAQSGLQHIRHRDVDE
jgi:hypothetical protein